MWKELSILWSRPIYDKVNFYLSRLTIDLKNPALRIYYNYSENSYKVLILFRNSISIYDFTNQDKIVFDKIYEFDRLEPITNSHLLFTNKYVLYESKTRVNVVKYDNKSIKTINFLKKDLSIFKDMELKLLNEFPKDLKFDYSYI